MRSVLGLLWPAALLALAGGCALLDRGAPAAQDDASATAMYQAQRTLDHLALMERLAHSDPLRQADIFEQVQGAAAASPTFANRLRYALVLAMPGHGASDPAAAREALRSLLATPDALLPAETSLAYVTLRDVDARLALASQAETLAAASREDKERSQALNRRLQAQVAENARLKQALDEALAKLEAVADLERSLVERQVVPKGQQP